MLNVAGYAESYRAGNITIIDTLPMSRRWDEGSIPDDEHPHGNNTLDAYAKRQGALDASKSERHLGLEDTHMHAGRHEASCWVCCMPRGAGRGRRWQARQWWQALRQALVDGVARRLCGKA